MTPSSFDVSFEVSFEAKMGNPGAPLRRSFPLPLPSAPTAGTPHDGGGR